MTRPGTRLRAIAARLFEAQTMARYVDPAIANLQTEYEETAKRGPWRERARVFVVGYIGVIQVMSIQEGQKAVDTVRELTGDDRRALLRTVCASTAVMIIGTLTVIATITCIPFRLETWHWPRPDESVRRTNLRSHDAWRVARPRRCTGLTDI